MTSVLILADHEELSDCMSRHVEEADLVLRRCRTEGDEKLFEVLKSRVQTTRKRIAALDTAANLLARLEDEPDDPARCQNEA